MVARARSVMDIEHICCMANARAKFKYALEQGGDIDASFFLDCIGELYSLEAKYEKDRLSREQIKDGSYTIDNSIAERFIRPLAGERKNSLFFGSGKMACASAAYHTIISTCKMQGIPVCNI